MGTIDNVESYIYAHLMPAIFGVLMAACLAYITRKADKSAVEAIKGDMTTAHQALESRVQYEIQRINEQLLRFIERLDSKIDNQIQEQRQESMTIRLGIHDIKNQVAALYLSNTQKAAEKDLESEVGAMLLVEGEAPSDCD